MDLLTTRSKKGLPGPAPRERALSRLTADPSLRYLLITDAPVEATLADFVVEEISEASRATGGKYASTSATRVAPSLVRSRSCPP